MMRVWLSLLSLVVATSVAALYLYVTLTAWDRFIFSASLYDPNLRLVRGGVQEALLCSGGILFGIIAGRMSPGDKRLQLIVCGSIVFVWLIPYGRMEGVLLPIVPLGGALLAILGVSLGRGIGRKGCADHAA